MRHWTDGPSGASAEPCQSFKQPQTFKVLVGPLKPIDQIIAEKKAKEVEKDLPTKPILPADE